MNQQNLNHISTRSVAPNSEALVSGMCSSKSIESIIRIFEAQEKYYKLLLDYDLLGDLVVFQYWGGKFNKKGNHKSSIVQSTEEGIALMNHIAVQRIKRGYVEIKNQQNCTLNKKRVSITKNSDYLNPKRYIEMLSHCQIALPHLFQNKDTPIEEFKTQILKHFPEYFSQDVSALLKQYLATPIFLGHTIDVKEHT